MSGRGSARLVSAAIWFVTATSCVAGTPSATPAIDTNGSLTEAGGHIYSIDPQSVTGFQDVRVVNSVFDSLLKIDPATLHPAPGAAQLPTISVDGLVYRFRLRDGLTYSDGRAVTAGDYAYGIGRNCDPRVNSVYRLSLVAIAGCAKWSALDPRTTPPDQLAATRRELFTTGIIATSERDLEIRLRTPAAYLTSVLSLWITAPTRQTEVERYGDNWYLDPANYIGNGPFVLTEWILGDRVVLDRNPRYPTPPKLKRMTLRSFADSQSALKAYQAGTIDRISGGTANGPTDLAQTVAAAGDRDLVTSSGSCSWFILLNHARPPLDDPKVRLALAKSIDREAYAQEIMTGLGVPATSFIPAGLPGNDPTDTAQSYDLTAAKQLLSESRYAGTDVLRTVVWNQSANATDAAKRDVIWITDRWRAIGLGITVQYVDPIVRAQQNRVLATKQLFMRSTWCADYPDQADWFSLFFTTSAQQGSADLGYRNPAVDAAIFAADRELDPSTRDAQYLRASRLVSGDVAAIWLTYNKGVALTRPWVGGLNVNAIDFGGLYHPAEVFVRPH